jgi:predicted enzyme involved in methoxymalonyl-ACP biosynthesis
MVSLYWLPESSNFRTKVRALPTDPAEAWAAGVMLAQNRLDFLKTNMLDQALGAVAGARQAASDKPVRLAILASCTVTHLHAAIRVAGLRRNIPITIYETSYGQYWQELVDTTSNLHAFRPDLCLFVLDAVHLTQGFDAGMDAAAANLGLDAVLDRLGACWHLAQTAFHCPVVQQTALPVHLTLLGNNEARLPGSPAQIVARLNALLPAAADKAGVHLLSVHSRVERDGLQAWFDPA